MDTSGLAFIILWQWYCTYPIGACFSHSVLYFEIYNIYVERGRFLSLYLCRNVFILSYFWNDSLAGYRPLSWQWFCFITHYLAHVCMFRSLLPVQICSWVKNLSLTSICFTVLPVIFGFWLFYLLEGHCVSWNHGLGSFINVGKTLYHYLSKHCFSHILSLSFPLEHILVICGIYIKLFNLILPFYTFSLLGFLYNFLKITSKLLIPSLVVFIKPLFSLSAWF